MVAMEHTDYRLAAIMFTDIVGFSRMMEEDELGTLKTLDFHDKLVREQVDKCRGSVIKTIGDAFLAQFNTTLDAVHCALNVQNSIAEYNEAKIGKPLTLRIGLHLGDIYFYDNDALGEGINIASRLQSATKPGHITISREVYSQVSGKIPMKVESMGQVHLKNITREVYAYEIIPGGEDNNSMQFQRSQKEPKVTETPEPLENRLASSPPASMGPPPNFRDLKEEWNTLKQHISMHPDATELLEELFEAPASKLKNKDGSPASAFQVYKQKRNRKAEKVRGGWASHLSSFVGVNVFLVFLCYLTQEMGLQAYPWFVYPLFGWGIGLASHWAQLRALRKTVAELEPINDMDDQDYRVLRTFQDGRTSFDTQVVVNTAVSVLLVAIWVVTGGGFPWHLIAIAGMALGVLGRLPGYLEAKKKFNSSDKKSVPQAFGEAEDSVVTKARALRDSILSQAQGLKGGNPFGEDMSVSLDNYVKQISELSAIEKEIGRVVSSFGIAELEAEEVVLRRKIEGSGSMVLKSEYERSLGEIDSQKKSFADLAEQQEILGLRLASSVKNLQQMQIDLAKIKGLSDGQKEGYFLTLKDKSEQLSRYLEDYREGLKDSSH